MFQDPSIGKIKITYVITNVTQIDPKQVLRILLSWQRRCSHLLVVKILESLRYCVIYLDIACDLGDTLTFT